MRPHSSVPAALVGLAVVLIIDSPARAQYVELPAFTIGQTLTDYATESADVATRNDGSFLAVWNEQLLTDHVAPVPLAIVNRRVTAPPAVGPTHRREEMISGGRPPSVTRLGDGYFQAWIEFTDGPHVMGAVTDEDGAPLHEFEISDDPTLEWPGREVAVAEIDLGAVAFWHESIRVDGAVVRHLVARIFDVQGNPRSASFEVGNAVGDPYVDVVRLADGGFMVGWSSVSGSNVTSFGRAYLANGLPRTEAFVFSTATLFRRLEVSADGATVAMVGTRPPQIALPQELWAGRYDADGVPLAPEFQVKPGTQNVAANPDLAFDLAGNLYVTWAESTGGTRGRGFDPADVPFGPAVTLTTAPASTVRTARLASGSFLNVSSTYAGTIVQGTVVSLCTPGTSICGDGTIDARCELCDDGGANSDVAADACRTTCRPAGCGDGVVDANETCDDGNRVSCDGCSASCTAETGLGCGDGLPFAACGELCDDGNGIAGDGCSPTCTLERVPGGGSVTTECYTEWSVENAANDPLLEKGQFRRLQVCTDGDARCDFDAIAGRCTFHVRQCANNTDVVGCTPGSRLSSWQLKTPSASQAAKKPAVAAARDALTGTLPSTIVGPSERDVCSPPAAVPVALNGSPGAFKAGKIAIKTLATQYDGSRDTDALKLICLPAP